MRKLILGLGLLAVSRLLARRQPGGLARFTSLPSLAAMMAGVAASQMLKRPHTEPANAAPDVNNSARAHGATGGNHRNHSFWRRFSLQQNNGE